MTKIYLFYDSTCDFCCKFSFFATKRNSSIISVPIQDKEARKILKNHGEIFVSLYTVYFILNHKLYKKSNAILELFGTLNFPYNLLFYFKIFPIKFRDTVYNVVAKNRYKLKW